MKSKCSFILKAATALVLALLMLFGTVSTSLAAVVDDLAETGAAKTLKIYCAITSSTLGSYTLKVNSNNNSWTQTNMTSVGNINDDWKLYSANVTTNGDGWLGNLQFQLYSGATHKGQKEPINSWTNCNSGYDNKVYFYDWSDGWYDVYKVAPFTYNSDKYYLKSDVPSDGEGWNDNTIAVTNTSDSKSWDLYLKQNEPDSNGLDIRFYDGPDSIELSPSANSNGYTTYSSGIKVYDKNGTNKIYNNDTSIRYDTSGFTAGKFYKVTVTLKPSTGAVTIANSVVGDMSLSITGTPVANSAFNLASACSVTGGVGDAIKNSYSYSTDGSSYTPIGDASAWTPTTSGTYYIKVNATDDGIVAYDSTSHKKDYNARSARTEDVVTTVTVAAPTCAAKIKNAAGTAELADSEIYSRQQLKFTVSDPNSHTSDLSITKDGTPVAAGSLGTYLSAYDDVATGTVVTFTPTAGTSNTYVISQSCNGTGSAADSVTITVNAEPTVYLNIGSDSHTMLYDEDSSDDKGKDGHVIYRFDEKINNSAQSIRVYDTVDRYITANTVNALTTHYPISGSGISLNGAANGNSFKIQNSNASATLADNAKTHFYYDLVDHTFYFEFPATVTWKYTKDNSASTVSTTTYVEYGNTTSGRSVTVEGYSQEGGSSDWYTNVGCAVGNKFSFSTELTNRTYTLYTPLTAKTSALTFNPNGGTGSLSTGLTATYDLAMPYPDGQDHVALPSRTGYSFEGYYDTDAATGGTQYYTSAGESARTWNKDITTGTTLYARWSEVKAGVAIKAYYGDSEGSTGGQVKTGNNALADSTTLADSNFGYDTASTSITGTANTGYHITGWKFDYLGASNTKYQHLLWSTSASGPWYTVDDSTTLYNQPGNNTTTSQTIYLKSDGTSGITNANTLVKAVFAINTHTFTLTKVSRSSSNVNYSADASIPDANISGSTASGTKNYNADLTYSGVSGGGYKFIGFYTNLDGTGDPADNMPDSDYTVYACFEKGVNVTFNDSDTFSSTTLKASTFTYYGARPAAPADPSHAGYSFDGWSSDGGNTTYATAGAIPVIAGTADITYVAQYTHTPYTVAIEARYTDDGTSYTSGVPTIGGSTGSISVTKIGGGGTFYYNDHITVSASAPTASYEKGYYVEKIEYSLDGGANWESEPVGTSPAAATATYANASTMSNDNYTLQENMSNLKFRVTFKAYYFITAYSSWVANNSGGYDKVAAPPKRITAGTRSYIYKATTTDASVTGEDNEYYRSTADGSSTPFTTHIIGTNNAFFYEGNKLVVYAGETVTISYSSLSSSEAIGAVFFNNSIRYTAEAEEDNLYTNREWQGVGNGTDDNYGTASGDPYTYLSATDTLAADKSFYSDSKYTTIDGQTYDGTIDQTAHTVTFTATKSYLNVDLELMTKKQITVNGGDWTGITVNGTNPEGYYYPAETVGTTITDKTTGFVIGLADGSNCSYKFTTLASAVTIVDKSDGSDVKSNFTIKAYDSSDNEEASDTKDISYFVIIGTMPNADVNITIGVTEMYTMKLNNVVVCDTYSNKVKLTQTDLKTHTSTSTLPDSYTGHIGTITAVVKNGETVDTAVGSSGDIQSDGVNRWYYRREDYSNAGTSGVYTNNSDQHNYYLAGGINEDGSEIQKGCTVTYEFTFAAGMDASYSFLGWFAGDASGYDPTRKLGSNKKLVYPPEENTYVWAVGTRNLYIKGSFNLAFAEGETTADATYSAEWCSAQEMKYDAEYINSDGTIKGRYAYTFKSVEKDRYYHYVFTDTSAGDTYGVWNSFKGKINANVAEGSCDDYGTRWGRNADSGSDKNNGYFAWRTEHETAGFTAPITIYFYPSAADSSHKLGVQAEYQWSKAYVSAGRGIDVLYRTYNDTRYENNQDLPDGATSANTTTTYNTPTVSVANETVNGETVSGTTSTNSYGNEAIYVCTVQEKNGAIRVTASPNDANLDVQAFLVYNIDTKKSSAVKTFTTAGSGAEATYTAEITVPQASNLYVVPIYKFTDDYIDTNKAEIESHTVYVRDINKKEWGGLVAMYSWGTKIGFDSGGWPGQLMVPADDGNSFYATLTFFKNGLAGLTFNNYAARFNGANTTFVGTYTNAVSKTTYSGNGSHTYQTYDYYEPISIINNLNNGKYEDEDQDLTFAIKSGNKTNSPGKDNEGTPAYNTASSFEYLTDRSGKYRVDLRGKAILGNPTETYRIVCSYTNDYKDSTQTYVANSSVKNEFSINWTVYDTSGNYVAGGDNYLSTSYTDLTEEDLTYIADAVLAAGEPVVGKAVKIAYENPGTWDEAIRYSGQWYADGTNTLIDLKVRIGVLSEGVFNVNKSSNDPGYGKVTVSASVDPSKDEVLAAEFGSGNTKATVTKKKANAGGVTITATNSEGNFVGWYYYDEIEHEYIQINADYTNPSQSPSFNDSITYYAFYRASATYAVKYPGRNDDPSDSSTWTKSYSVKGADLSDDELAVSGNFTSAMVTARDDDITERLSTFSDVHVFNRTFTIDYSTATVSPYTITYLAVPTASSYNLTVFSYNESGELVEKGTASGSFNTTLDVTEHASLGNGTALTKNKPEGHSDYVFIGWVEYDGSTPPAVGNPILSTQHNFGYSLTRSITIAPLFGTPAQRTSCLTDTWTAAAERNEITQEKTSSSDGTIYNDTLVAFRNNSSTSTRYDLDSGDCGIIILAQTKDAYVDETVTSTTRTKRENFSALTKTNVTNYLNYLKTNSLTSGKMKEAKFGESYAFYISATSLSSLNRADIYQALDYSKFAGGQYMVASYVKCSNGTSTINGATYEISDVITGTYTPGVKKN